MKKVDLGKYDLTQLLRNPGLIHKIQDNLMTIKNESIIGGAIREIAKDDIKACIKMIVSQYYDNPKVMTEIVGRDTLNFIEEFEGITLADDLKDINI
jgi:threonine dehydrogenase-like Zn-dependent dehydrogenase